MRYRPTSGVTRPRIASWRGAPSAIAACSWSRRISSGIAVANSSPHRAHGNGSWSIRRGGYNRLQDFGIRFQYERVVIYLQPTVQPGRLEANIARTSSSRLPPGDAILVAAMLVARLACTPRCTESPVLLSEVAAWCCTPLGVACVLGCML